MQEFLVNSCAQLGLFPLQNILEIVLCPLFAFFFVKDFALVGNDLFYIPLMCVMCVAIPFVLVTIAPRFITAAEVNLFFLLETILGPLWVWMVIKEQPSNETIYGGIVIIITIAIHSLLAIKKTQTKTT